MVGARVAHFLTFWGFIVLILTIIEAWGGLFDRDFHIPGIGRWAAIGFVEDLFAVGVLVGIVTFAILRIRQAPARRQRESRFYGSHTRAAWVILGMIALVVITLLIYRGPRSTPACSRSATPHGRSPPGPSPRCCIRSARGPTTSSRRRSCWQRRA